MPTAALSAAKANILRAEYFLDLHEGTQVGPGTPNLKRRELPRGAVVFAIGALDAYLSEVAAEVMIAQFQNGQATGDSMKVLATVQREFPSMALRLAVAGPDVDRAEVLRSAIVAHFHEDVSNHGAKAVASTVQRMGASSNALWSAVQAAGQEDPQQGLDEWTGKRHRIVHQGEAVPINRDPARECVGLVSAICSAVDSQAEAAKASLGDE